MNRLVARDRGVLNAFIKAEKDYFNQHPFPYIFIDSSNKGFLSSYRLFTNIIGRFRIGYSNAGMKAYLVPQDDFEILYNIIREEKSSVKAQRNADSIRREKTKLKIEKSSKKNRKRKRESEKVFE